MTMKNSPQLRGVNTDYAYLIHVTPHDAHVLISMLPRMTAKTLRFHSTLRGLWLGFYAHEATDARGVLKNMTVMMTSDYPVLEFQRKAVLPLRLMDTTPEVECVYRFEHEAFVQCISTKASLSVSREFSHVLVPMTVEPMPNKEKKSGRSA